MITTIDEATWFLGSYIQWLTFCSTKHSNTQCKCVSNVTADV